MKRHEESFNPAIGRELVKLKAVKPKEPEPEAIAALTPEEIEAREKKRLLLKQQAEMLGIKK